MTVRPSWTPPELPTWARKLNSHGTSVGGPERLVGLDRDELIETARSSTGLRDFGDDGWRSHFDALMDSIDAECTLHLVGRMMLRADLLRVLGNRLALADAWVQTPQIRDESTAEPLFVVGAARSGTSILHELLALDPAHRAPLGREVHHPLATAGPEHPAETADDLWTFWHEVLPDYEAMHTNGGDLPAECIFITGHQFISDQWAGNHTVPAYSMHVAMADHAPAYAYHRAFLQTLQHGQPTRRWVLKAPSHLPVMGALFAEYPDARIVHIHRDPLKTVPSTLSLMGTLQAMRCEGVDLAPLASMLPGGMAHIQRQLIEDRASGAVPDAQFHDVRYSDLIADPVGSVSGIYDRFSWDAPVDLGKRIVDYLTAKPRHSRGVHPYSVEEMGLSAEEERERFRFYTDRFEIPTEG